MKDKIYLNETNKLLEFNFLNGSINFYKNEYGAYVMSPGCGSGKTTIIKELIRQKWDEGILYSAFTKDEVDRMYQFCKTLIGFSHNNNVLTEKDIIVLHSDIRSEGVDNNLWRNNPQELMNKKIILCTHHKLLNEPIGLLIGFKLTNKQVYSYKSSALMGVNMMPRQWILVDENIESSSIKKRINKDSVLNLGQITQSKRIVDNTNPNRPTYRTIELENSMIERKDLYYSDFLKTVELLSFYSKEFKNLLPEESDNELSKLKKIQVLDELFDNYESYVNNNLSDTVKITYGIHSLSTKHMKTHLIIFDGTGDITLSSSRKFTVLSYPNKYSSRIKLSILPFNLNRYIKPDKSINNIDIYLRDKLNYYIDSLAKVISQNNKTLIFTWKSFKSDNSEVNDDVDDGKLADMYEMVEINPILNLPTYITNELINKGIDRSGFSIEYYGSGKDKAINDYREYDAVVLLGRYVVPSYVINEFNYCFESSITGVEYYANRVVQAICRTRIRNHKGESVNVYMSSDWDRNIINYISRYLNSDIIENPGLSYSEILTRLLRLGIPNKRSERMAKICEIDNNILYSIESGQEYHLRIDLNYLYSRYPMSRKDADKYRNVVKNLYDYGIYLEIK